MTRFTEVARDVYVLRYPVLDINVTLVVGDGEALLVDTLATDAQAHALADAARAVTSYPWMIVNTHHHFDHCFGNAVLAGAGCPIWGHEEAAALLTERPQALAREAYQQWASAHPELAEGLADVRVVPPDRLVHRAATLRVGGRLVLLRHLGRGHTAGDLLVQVPDADVLVAGDLVEEGAPPSFEDSYPIEWPETLAELLHLVGAQTVVVPGHGALVGREFVTGQHAELTSLAWLIREGHADGAPVEAVVRRAWRAGRGDATAPFGPAVAGVAVRRGYRELAGRSG